MKLKNNELLEFAFNFADISKNILEKNYFKHFNVEEKSDGSLVTNIDKEIEEKFRKYLKKNFQNMVLLVKNLVTKKKIMNMCG